MPLVICDSFSSACDLLNLLLGLKRVHFTAPLSAAYQREPPPPYALLTPPPSHQLSAAVDKPRMAYWKQAYEQRQGQTDWRGGNWHTVRLTESRIVAAAAQKSNWSMNWNWNWSRKQRLLKPSCALRPDGGNAIKYPASWVNRRYIHIYIDICSMLSIHKGRFRYGGNSIWMFEGMNNADYFDAKWQLTYCLLDWNSLSLCNI